MHVVNACFLLKSFDLLGSLVVMLLEAEADFFQTKTKGIHNIWFFKYYLSTFQFNKSFNINNLSIIIDIVSPLLPILWILDVFQWCKVDVCSHVCVHCTLSNRNEMVLICVIVIVLLPANIDLDTGMLQYQILMATLTNSA